MFIVCYFRIVFIFYYFAVILCGYLLQIFSVIYYRFFFALSAVAVEYTNCPKSVLI